MRFIAKVMACVGVLVTLAGCDPVTDRRYMNEGAGVDLNTADSAQQAELLNQYLAYICGPDRSICGGDWTTTVHAGMNDIDQRCDGFLTWLDAKRRDKEPILAQLAALTAAAHSIMTVTGSSPKSLDILTAAFGLATASYTNWNSRLLISVNQSTVQQIVYKGQGDFRGQIKSYIVPDQPTAVYLLRNYLRLCMPITIEAAVNITTALVLNDAPRAARANLVVATTTPRTAVRVSSTYQVDNATTALTKYIYPDGVMGARNAGHAKEVRDYLGQNNIDASITFFLKSATYATERAALARQLGLIH